MKFVVEGAKHRTRDVSLMYRRTGCALVIVASVEGQLFIWEDVAIGQNRLGHLCQFHLRLSTK